MHIERGTTRAVLLIGKYAIKFPRIHHEFKDHRWKMFLRGILANIDEAYWWKHSHHKDKLCPVKWKSPFGFILIMQRADPFTREEYDADLNGLIKRFSGLPFDAKVENFGKIDERIVLVDYADSKYMCSDCSNCFKNR